VFIGSRKKNLDINIDYFESYSNKKGSSFQFLPQTNPFLAYVSDGFTLGAKTKSRDAQFTAAKASVKW